MLDENELNFVWKIREDSKKDNRYYLGIFHEHQAPHPPSPIDILGWAGSKQQFNCEINFWDIWYNGGGDRHTSFCEKKNHCLIFFVGGVKCLKNVFSQFSPHIFRKF